MEKSILQSRAAAHSCAVHISPLAGVAVLFWLHFREFYIGPYPLFQLRRAINGDNVSSPQAKLLPKSNYKALGLIRFVMITGPILRSRSCLSLVGLQLLFYVSQTSAGWPPIDMGISGFSFQGLEYLRSRALCAITPKISYFKRRRVRLLAIIVREVLFDFCCTTGA